MRLKALKTAVMFGFKHIDIPPYANLKRQLLPNLLII